MESIFKDVIWKTNRWVLWLIAASVTIGGLSIYWGDSTFGIISAVTGVACVILTAKGYKEAFIVGAINTLMYALIALSSNYYGDFMLNAFYYFPMQFVGWRLWSRNEGSTGEINARSLNKKQIFNLAIVIIIGVIVYGMILNSLGGALPIVDSISTVLSVLAMYLSVKCYKEQWVLWVIINCVSIYMWFTAIQGGATDYATLLMWLVYLANSVYGYRHWSKLEREAK